MKKIKKSKKTMIERLRDIRDKINMDIQDMSFEEMQEYFKKRRAKFENKANNLIVAEPKAKYGKK